MTHTRPELPYALDALAPIISSETLQFHALKHHQTYVDNLNKLIPQTPFETLSLADIVMQAPAGGIFNNAAQIENHTLYFENLRAPRDNNRPSAAFTARIEAAFGSYEQLLAEMEAKALSNFGSGWTWLVEQSGTLEIVNTTGADTPRKQGKNPLLVVDVWEHAYYVDYRNRRAEYLKQLWNLINWDVVEARSL